MKSKCSAMKPTTSTQRKRDCHQLRFLVRPPAPPDMWDGYVPNHNAPSSFSDIANPGGWSEYTFQPVYKDKKYQGHFTPSATKVVPADDDGVRQMNG